MDRNELRAGIDYVAAALDTIHTAAADREMTDIERASWDEGLAYVTDARSQIERHDERQTEIERARQFLEAHPETETVPGDGTVIEGFNVNTRKAEDPFDLSAAPAYGAERSDDLRGRAIEAIERSNLFLEDDHKESATRLVERHAGAREQILLTSDPVYRSAFAKVCTGETPNAVEAAKMAHVDQMLRSSGFFNPDSAERAVTVGNVTGKLVPAFLDPSVVLTNTGAANPFRDISRVESITTNVWTGVSSAGITAEWTGAEASQVADAAPTFANPAVTAFMWDAFVPLSFQAYEDWASGESEILVMVADAKNRLEEAAFATGAGSGSSQPRGVATALDANTNVEVTMTTAGTFDVTQMYRLLEALPPRYRSNASFVQNLAYIDRIRQFGTSNNYSGFTVDLTADGIPVLLGKKMYESTTLSGTLATTHVNAIVYGDFSNYLIADRIGTVMEFIPNLFGANGRPTGQRGYLVHGRTGADSINDLGFRVLQTS